MEKHNKVISRIIYMCMVVLLIGSSIVMAAVPQTERLEATMNQYFELGATEIKTVEGQNKQVIMELWGYDLEFTRI